MVRIQLFSLFYYMSLRLPSSFTFIKMPNLATRTHVLQPRLKRLAVKYLSLVYSRLGRRAVKLPNSRLQGRYLTRWKGSYTNRVLHMPRVLTFIDFSLGFMLNPGLDAFRNRQFQTQIGSEEILCFSDLPSSNLNIDYTLRFSGCYSGWRCHTKFVKWYLVNLNTIQLEYWRGGYELQSASFVHYLRLWWWGMWKWHQWMCWHQPMPK